MKQKREAAAAELKAAKDKLATLAQEATTEREAKRAAIVRKTEAGAQDALKGAKESQRKGFDAQDIRTSGGLSALAQAAHGGSLQTQMLNFQKKTADQATIANMWNQKNWQQLTALNDNLPLEATPIDGGA